MPDVREVFDMVTKKAEPEPGALQRQGDRQRKRVRNQKIVVIAVVVAIFAGGAAVFFGTRSGGGTAPASQPPSVTPAVPLNTSPPIGAQMVALDGNPMQQLDGLPFDAAGFRLSPDGTMIAFHSGTVSSDDIETIKADGTGLTDLVRGNANHGDATTAVSWSPDGTKLVYAWSGNIYVMDLDGSNRHRLTDSKAGTGSYWPAWSPDGSTIVYWSGASTGVDGGPSNSEIYTVSANGGAPPIRLTHDNVSDIEPTWSPDGRIAYWHGGDLWIMRSDGGGAHHVYSDPGGTWAPAWSPTGTQIAYLTYQGARSASDQPLLQVRVLDLRTGKARSLHMNVATDFNGPSWDPTGTALLVNRYD